MFKQFCNKATISFSFHTIIKSDHHIRFYMLGIGILVSFLFMSCEGNDQVIGVEADITAFQFLATDNEVLEEDVLGSINVQENTIDIILPLETDVTSLIPNIINSEGAKITPSILTPTDFTDAVTYTVISELGTTKEYTIRVRLETVAAISEITTFQFLASENSGLSETITATIDEVTRTITAIVPDTIDRSALVPHIVTSEGTSIAIFNVPTDFSTPVTYTITAEDGSTKDYIVTVISDIIIETGIISFSFLATDNYTVLTENAVGVINQEAKTITVELPASAINGITTLVPTITVIRDENIRILNKTPTDFSQPVEYKVTEDGREIKYVVTIVFPIGTGLLPGTGGVDSDFGR